MYALQTLRPVIPRAHQGRGPRRLSCVPQHVRLEVCLWGAAIIGDRSWFEGLGYGYEQHLADSARYDREPQPFERWAVAKTFPYFVRLVGFCKVGLELGTGASWPPGANGSGYGASVLAGRLCDAQILTKAAMTYVYRCSHGAHAAVKAHIDKGRVGPGGERALAKGKRLVYDYLRQAAETEEVLCQRI